MVRRDRRASFLVAALLAAAVAIPSPGPADASRGAGSDLPPPAHPASDGPVTALFVDSEPDDWYGGGLTWFYAPPESLFEQPAILPDDRAMVWRVHGPGESWQYWWSFMLQLPADGPPLAPGTYLTTRMGGGGTAAFDVGATGKGCNTAIGSVTIHELVRDPAGTVTSFAASFRYVCDGTDLAQRGLSGEIRYASAYPLSALLLDTPALDFGEVAVQATSAVHEVVIRNPGTVDQAITATITGPDARSFSVTGTTCSPGPLAPGASCAISVTFTPQVFEQRTAALEITDSTARGGRVVPLTGMGMAPTTTTITFSDPIAVYPGGTHVTATVSPPSLGTFQFEAESGIVLGRVNVSHPVLAPARVRVALPPGTDRVRARFLGQAPYAASTSAWLPLETVIATRTTLDFVDGAAEVGRPLRLHARVLAAGTRPVEGGTLTIRDATTSTTLATVAVDRRTFEVGAVLELYDLDLHQIVASYSGDGAFIESAASGLARADPIRTATDVTASASDLLPGAALTLEATVRPVPESGFVEFRRGTTVVAALPVDPASGVARAVIRPEPGVFTVEATFVGVPRFAASSGMSPEIRVISTNDTTPPAGTVAVVEGAYVRARTVTLRFDAADPDPSSGVDAMRYAIGTGSWSSWMPYSTSRPVSLPDADGRVAILAQFRDWSGNLSPVAQAQVTLDRRAPQASSPGVALRSAVTLTGTAVPVRVAARATDAFGVVRLDLGRSIAGGAWTTATLPGPSGTAYEPIPAGRDIRYRLRAFDRAGNASSLAYTTVRAAIYEESSPSVRYVGTWTRAADDDYHGGAVRATGRAGARASLRFSGRSVAFVSTRGPARGRAVVYVDGVRVAVLDLYAATVQRRQVVYARSWSTTGTHTVELRPLGTRNRASTSSRVDLDAFVVLR